ncbi:MAG: hypothetical protein II130_06740, partial [Bacteroidales bacterium]|nr:hypothetical protein [Bacteroidales bacterium]
MAALKSFDRKHIAYIAFRSLICPVLEISSCIKAAGATYTEFALLLESRLIRMSPLRTPGLR